MKKYDKIFVPVNGADRIPDEGNEVHAIFNLGDVDMLDTGIFENNDLFKGNGLGMKIASNKVEWLDKNENIIVLTVEELSQLWNAGHSAGMEDAGAKLKNAAVDFETYLQSKGITIP